MEKTREQLEQENAALVAEVARLRAALVRSAMNNHIARHGEAQRSSAEDWVKCPAESCVDARAALAAPGPGSVR